MKKLKYLLFIIPFLLIPKVNAAELVDWSIADFNSSSDHIKSTWYAANEINRYGPNHFTFNGKGEFFVKLTTCGTGNLYITSVSNTNGITFFSGMHKGGSCNVQGYEGSIYEYYWTVKETIDAGGGNRSCLFYFDSKSVGYYSFVDYLGVYIADTIPADITIPDYSAEFDNISYRIGNVETSQSQIQQKQNEILAEQNAIKQEQQKTTDAVNNVNDTLNNNDSSGATNEADTFFSGFETDTFGLTSIITAPLNLIGSITSSSCSPLPLKVPFLSENNTLNLPCFKSIYEEHFGSFLIIYQTITFGIVAYWVCVKIFNLVKDFKNPEHDEIEVLDL